MACGAVLGRRGRNQRGRVRSVQCVAVNRDGDELVMRWRGGRTERNTASEVEGASVLPGEKEGTPSSQTKKGCSIANCSQ